MIVATSQLNLFLSHPLIKENSLFQNKLPMALNRMHNLCFRLCRGSRDQQEYYSLSQTDINAAIYLRISIPRRQKTFLSSQKTKDILQFLGEGKVVYWCLFYIQHFTVNVVLSGLFRIGTTKISTSKPMLEVVFCGARGINFAAILDSYQFKTLVQIFPCLHLQIHPE